MNELQQEQLRDAYWDGFWTSSGLWVVIILLALVVYNLTV